MTLMEFLDQYDGAIDIFDTLLMLYFIQHYKRKSKKHE